MESSEIFTQRETAHSYQASRPSNLTAPPSLSLRFWVYQPASLTIALVAIRAPCDAILNCRLLAAGRFIDFNSHTRLRVYRYVPLTPILSMWVRAPSKVAACVYRAGDLFNAKRGTTYVAKRLPTDGLLLCETIKNLWWWRGL